MKKKHCLLMALVCCVAVFAVAFAACNDEGGKSGGAGDVIFTEGASLEDILTALENAESLSMTQRVTIDGTDSVMEAKMSTDAMNVAYIYGADVMGDDVGIMEYQYRSDGIVYFVRVFDGDMFGGSSIASKDLEVLNTFTSAWDNNIAMILEMVNTHLTTDEGGNIVLSDNIVGNADYVEGSGYVKLTGSSIEIGWSVEDSEAAIEEHKITVSGVNATTVEIPGEVRALEAKAEWSYSVAYNGIVYEKAEDENGDEYYCIVSRPDASAVPEKTINTLPVKA